MKHRKRSQEKQRDGFRWVIGVPYFVQGTSSLAEVPILYFIKFVLGMGDAGGQLFDSLRQTGWFVKPLWGYISDRFPLLGSHRKSWYVLMAFLAVIFWTLNALLSYLGVSLAPVYLLTFNLAFATYAFVDVVSDALMVKRGRDTGQVGSLINFQWTVLAAANALAVYLGGWLQGKIQEGSIEPWLVFLATGAPPLLTAVVGIRNIEEEPAVRAPKTEKRTASPSALAEKAKRWRRRIAESPEKFRRFRKRSRPLWLLVLFIFFWKFSPSVGYIERSYLIDVRGFTAASFGVILGVGGVAFLGSVLAYAWVVNRFLQVPWYGYLYAMVGLGVVAFPLSFYFYLDPGHPWWDLFSFRILEGFNPLPGWNRYQWFRLVFQTVLGFATIPAFIIPLTIAGETVSIARAGVGYAFLMSLSNVTNLFEGVVGAGLYRLFQGPLLSPLLALFQDSFLNVAGTEDERTLILQIFVYISLGFTLLTVPFIEMLRRELSSRGIRIRLGKKDAAEGNRDPS